MASVNQYPQYYGSYNNGTWTGWTRGTATSLQLTSDLIPWVAYRLTFPAKTATVTSVTLKLGVEFQASDTTFPLTVRCYLFKGTNPQSTSAAVTSTTATVNNGNPTDLTFSFSSLSISDATDICLRVQPVGSHYFGWAKLPNVTANFSYPSIGLGLTPTTLTAGEQVTVTFANQLGQNIDLALSCDDTPLKSVTASGTLQIATEQAWFETVGETGSYIDVDVAASDGLGRSETGSFRLNRQQASTPTPTAPINSANVSGSSAISFTWSVATGHGTQTRAEVQWSVDQTNWSSLGTVSGSGTQVQAAAYTFPAGSVYWRVRTLNNYGYWSDWASARFNATYSTLTMSLSPATVTAGEDVTVTFGNREGRTVSLLFKYGSTELATAEAAGDTLDVTCAESWFTDHSISATSISVSVTGTDTLGRTVSGSFTLKTKQSSPATAYSPKSTSVDCSAGVPITWTLDEANGTVTKTEIQWSPDNVTWTALHTVSGNGTTWTAPAMTFHPAGTIYWRVRTTNSRGVVSAWSSASFTATYPALQIVLAPPNSVYVGSVVNVGFYASTDTRLGQTIKVTFRYGQNALFAPISAAGNIDVTCLARWFTDQSVTGNSMRIDVDAVDENLGREATTFFTLWKKLPSPATPTSPKNTEVPGSSSITFSWDVDETHGAQTKAELQWSKNGTSWTPLATYTGANHSYTWQTSNTFPLGRVYWRIRTTNANGVVSDWSSSVYFTVTYSTLGFNPSPSSLDMGETSRITISNLIYAGLPVTYEVKCGDTVLIQPKKIYDRSFFDVPTDPNWFFRTGITGNSLNADVTGYDELGREASTRLTVYRTAATMDVAPSSVYVDTQPGVGITLGNTCGFGFSLTFTSGATSLDTYTYTGADAGDGTRRFVCPERWFSQAGSSGSSLSVTVAYADDIGRTVSRSFTVIRPQGSTFTAQAPKSVTRDGAEAINFAWTVSSDWGTQTKAELQWSTDNATWETLGTVNGSATTFPVDATYFPGGTVYWRGRVTNSFGVVGSWSSSASFTVAYSAVSRVVAVNSPTGGIIDASRSNVFSVELQATAPVHDAFQMDEATFFWRMADEGGSFTEVAMTPNGSGASVTIAADTFGFGDITWYVTAIDTVGNESSTPFYTITAMTATVDAYPVSPDGTVESGNGPIVFRWRYGSMDGSAQAAAELQWSTDNENWQALASVAGSGTEWTAPAGTFSAGTVFWRVRAENSAEEWGPWSRALSFVCFAAPHVLGVQADDLNLMTVSWQVEGQVAYEIRLDGDPDWTGMSAEAARMMLPLPKNYGPYFGTEARSYTIPDYLPGGTFTVSVRAQNAYGLWSEWTSAVSVRANLGGNLFFPGFNAETSPSVSLSLDYAQAVAPIILQQPTDMQGTSGTVTFSVVIDDYWQALPLPLDRTEGMSYVWETRLGGGDWESIADSDSPELTVTCSEAIDGAEFRCRIYSPGYMDGPLGPSLLSAAEACSETAHFYYRDPSGEASAPVTGFFPGYGVFRLYRDGVPIAESYTGDFTDRAALGPHTYVVLQQNDENTITAIQVSPTGEAPGPITSTVPCPMIAPLSGGDFLPLRLSASAGRAETVTRQREIAYVQYAGDRWPTAEIGEHESLTAAFDCAWLHDEAELALAFEALLGKTVILKIPGGTCAIGVLAGFERRDPRFYRSYSCTIRQTEWREFSHAEQP